MDGQSSFGIGSGLVYAVARRVVHHEILKPIHLDPPILSLRLKLRFVRLIKN